MAIFNVYFDKFTVRQTSERRWPWDEQGWQRQEVGASDWSKPFPTREQAIVMRCYDFGGGEEGPH